MISFAYYGAKNGLLKHLLPLLPECSHYCEPFCGSAAVLLNRRPSPIETLNDLNSDIVNFFQVLRKSPLALVDSLLLTPYSREEFENAWRFDSDPVERARRFYIRTQMDVAKAGHRKDKSWSVNIKYSIGQHSYAVKNFHSKIPGLIDVADRLKMAQIENKPAVEIIRRYDSPQTLFYCDPPYMHSTRTSNNDYKHEMAISDHVELAKALNECSAMVAISGYDSPEMASLYKGWSKIKFKAKQVPMSRGKGLVKQECLWVNYDPYIKADVAKKQYRIL